MNTRGIIRRIDDLGRVVIPKEIRQNLRINKGENIEIFLDEKNEIILKKYNQIDKLTSLSQTITKTLNQEIKKDIIITNTTKIISISGPNKKEYQDQEISHSLSNIIQNRIEKTSGEKEKIQITDSIENKNYAIIPLSAHSDSIGSIIILSEEKITKEEIKTLKIFSTFLTNYIEQ